MLSPTTRDGPCRAARGVGRHTGCPAQRIVRRVPTGLPRLSWNPRPTAGVGPLRRSAAKRPPVLGRSPLALRPTSWPSGTETRIQHPVAHARLGEDVGGLPRHRPACQLSPLTGGEHQSACRPGMVGQPPGERGTLSRCESGHLPFRQVFWLASGLFAPTPSHSFGDSGRRPGFPLTVARLRRTLTAFPILPEWAPERAVIV